MDLWAKTMMGQIPPKFSVPPSDRTTGLIWNSLCENGTDMLYLHAKFGDDLLPQASSRRRSSGVFCLSVRHSVCLTRLCLTE